jgi:hypothetical protein
VWPPSWSSNHDLYHWEKNTTFTFAIIVVSQTRNSCSHSRSFVSSILIFWTSNSRVDEEVGEVGEFWTMTKSLTMKRRRNIVQKESLNSTPVALIGYHLLFFGKDRKDRRNFDQKECLINNIIESMESEFNISLIPIYFNFRL